MFHSKRIRLITVYFAFWLLGTTILSAFAAPVQADFNLHTQTTTPAAGLAAQAGNIVGVSREGSEAVSLTSSQIGLKKNSSAKTARPHKILPVRSRSGVISQPDSNAPQPAQPDRSVEPLNLSGFPSSNFSFPGNTASQDDIDNLPFQQVPPDTMGAAGPSQFVMAINGMLRVFTKTTGVPEHPFGASDPDLDTFFSAVMTPVAVNDINYTTFPRVRYDRFTSRWFILVNDVPGGLATRPNRILLAVSDGPVITSGTAWKFFFFQPDSLLPSYPGDYADNPTLGIDTNALYIGVNLYDQVGLAGTAAFVVRKSSVLGSGQIFVTGFAPLSDNTDGLFTPVGVDNLDGSVSDGYFVGVNNTPNTSPNTKLQLRKVTNPGGTPLLSDNIPVTVDAYQQPVLVNHKGGGSNAKNKLDPVDNRLINAVIRNGSLWTAHNIGVGNTGASTSNNDRDGARWYEIKLSPTPALNQSGTVFDSTSQLRNYWMPSLTVSGQGHTVMGLNVAGVNDYISAAFTGRVAGDSLNTMRPAVLYQPSSVAYNPENNSGDGLLGRRWGDYSFTSLDPEDNMTFWTIQEYAYNSDSDPDDGFAMDGYGIQIARINAPPPATPISSSPNLAPGQQSVSLTITADSSNDSGFYEPGPGFAKHLSVSIDGGITVNNITAITPTTINLNVSTTLATTGLHSVTVTNPDGQSITVPGIVSVNNYSCTLPVTTGADSGDGSLRQAIETSRTGCKNIILSTSDIITLEAPLPDDIPAGLVITTDKPCSAGKVEIDGSNITAVGPTDGLILHGGSFYGMYIHGFTNRQIWAEDGKNIFKCVTAESGTS